MNEGVEWYLNQADNSDYLRPDPDEEYLDEFDEEAWNKKCEEDRIAWEQEQSDAEAELAYLQSLENQSLPCKIGDFIHIKPRNGIYEVIEATPDYFTITCKRWQQEYERKERSYRKSTYTWDNFKCLKG